MRVLREGSVGDDVTAWENFLVGFDRKLVLVVDGNFKPDTTEATKQFQRAVGFKGTDIDGVVGTQTLIEAGKRGFALAKEEPHVIDKMSSNWPPKPPGFKFLSSAERDAIFGKFSFVPAPSAANPEGIKITDDWAKKNVVTVEIPQLKNLVGAPRDCRVQFHVKGAEQLRAMFAAWEDAGLSNRLVSWAGSWVPRFIRGSRTTLSNHATATAFDINAAWNGLGVQPALVGQKGCVRELVEIATQHGFAWGGWFSTRPDGMHFELYKIL